MIYRGREIYFHFFEKYFALPIDSKVIYLTFVSTKQRSNDAALKKLKIMKSIRIDSFLVSYDPNSLVIDSIKFASSKEEADFSDVARRADRRVGDGNNVDVFGFDMSNQPGINAIAFTGGANYVCDFQTEKEIIEG